MDPIRLDNFSQRKNIYLFWLVILIALTVWLLKLSIFGLQSPVGDGPLYFAMAEGAEGDPPFSFHILTPRLARIIPVSTGAGFFVIASISFVLASVAIASMLGAKSFGLSAGERIFGATLFMATYPGVAMFRSYFLTDSLSYALLAVACAAVIHRRDGLLAIATLVGVFNRETALFIVPVWIASNAGHPLTRTILRFIIVFGPAFVGYILLHHTPLFFGHQPAHLNYLRPDIMRHLWNNNLSWLGTQNKIYGLAICIFLSYGPVWFAAAYGYYKSIFVSRNLYRQQLLALSLLALPTGLALLVVDWRRGFQPIFPAIILAAVVGIQSLTAGMSRWYWYANSLGTIIAAMFTAEAWWSEKISVPVIICMVPWCCLVMYTLYQCKTCAKDKSENNASENMGSVSLL